MALSNSNKKTTRTVVVTAILKDGTSRYVSSRALTPGEDIDLYFEARTAYLQCVEQDRVNERRFVRNLVPRTVTVQADLRINGHLENREEAWR